MSATIATFPAPALRVAVAAIRAPPPRFGEADLGAPRRRSEPLTGRPCYPHLARRAEFGLFWNTASKESRRRRCSSSEGTAFPALEGFHDPPGKRPDNDSAHAPQEHRWTGQGPRGRGADPAGHGRAARHALLLGPNRANPRFEPAKRAEP